MRLTRRAALLGLTAAATLGRVSLAFGAAGTERRLVVVILRGALDGMGAVVPYGDAALADLRTPLLPAGVGQPEGALDLGGFFGLHPALPGLHVLYEQGEMLALHAVASDDRSRSHFVAQDTLEYGIANRSLTSGWLNRVAGLLPARGAGETALAIGAVTPPLLHGPAPVGHWSPPSTQSPPADFYAQLAALHAGDGTTGKPIARALQERGFNAAALAGMPAPPNKGAFPALCSAAGRLLAAPDGPRLAAFELEGWDTHTRQKQVLAGSLKNLDDGLVALKAALGDAWGQTAVLVLTEFGRTARANGTGGTDHGTGTAAFLLGGTVAGGRVRADWPGLGPGRLFENRDLQPTVDVRAVAKGVLAEHFGLPAAALAQVFPGSDRAGAMRGVMRA